MSFLELQSVSKRYGRTLALDGISLSVAPHSRTAVVGPSGSGKSTLLRLIAGFEVPDAGRISLAGRVLADGSKSLPAHRRGIGIVAQDGALFPHLSIADNIGFGLPRDMHGREARIADLLRMVELDAAILQRRPDQLSGGQQQRVALARALAPKPRLLLLDEPFSALDTALRSSTRKAVANLLVSAGVTAILVTHDQEEALSFADQVAVMRGGRLQQVGAPRDLYLHPADAMVAEFLGDAILLQATLEDGVAVCDLGSIPVAANGARATGQLMLRPEQITLLPVGDARGVGVFGTVVEADFGGAICTLTVSLRDVTRTLKLRRPSPDAPPIGASVQVTVHGSGHVLP